MSVMRFLMCFAIGAAWGAASADETPDSLSADQAVAASHLHLLDTCLADVATGGSTEESCIGVSVYACLNDALTTADMLACIEPELAYWDARLNESYRTLYAVYSEQDTADGFSPIKLAPRLRDVQRVWIDWRDAKCGLAYDKYRGGTMGRITGADCHLQETAERALELEELLEEARY